MVEIPYQDLFSLKKAVEEKLQDDKKWNGNKTIYMICKTLAEEYIELSQSQLEGIWYWKPKELKTYRRMKENTLKVLLEYVGWESLKHTANTEDLGTHCKLFTELTGNMIKNLNPAEIREGEYIRLEINPHKYCVLLKLYDIFKFKIVECMGIRRSKGDVFYAEGFEVTGDFTPYFKIYNDGWFDEPEQADLKEQKDYFIL